MNVEEDTRFRDIERRILRIEKFITGVDPRVTVEAVRALREATGESLVYCLEILKARLGNEIREEIRKEHEAKEHEAKEHEAKEHEAKEHEAKEHEAKEHEAKEHEAKEHEAK